MDTRPALNSRTCFVEADTSITIARRAGAEALGTFLLVVAAGGAGYALARLAADCPALTMLAGAMVTASALVGLIIAFGEISGGHFNPLITCLQWLQGARSLHCALSYVTAQIVGGIAGALTARCLFSGGGVAATPGPATWTTTLSEVMASAGLMTIVFSCARSGRKDAGPFAVGAWLFAAIVATPSHSYANPAITIAALFARGPVALSPLQAVVYVAAECVGALIALVLLSLVWSTGSASSRSPVELRLGDAG